LTLTLWNDFHGMTNGLMDCQNCHVALLVALVSGYIFIFVFLTACFWQVYSIKFWTDLITFHIHCALVVMLSMVHCTTILTVHQSVHHHT